jgi:hypothetical protein
MAQSLVKLTLESNQYERNLRQAQKSLDDFTKGIGLNMKQLSGMALAVGAVTTALKVAKDAFFNNEQQLDDWNRAVASAESVYKGFLHSLNTGDISGFLSNINTITEAAQAAYNALDNLGTFNAFNQINTQRTRTGMAEAIAGFRSGETSKEDVKAAAEAYKKELQTRQKLEQEAYRQQVRKIAAERGVSWGGLEQALTGKYGDYQKLKEVMPTGERMVSYGAGMFGSGSYIEKFPVTIEEKMGAALRALNDTELQSLQALGAQAERTGEEIAQIDKQLSRVMKGGSATSVSGAGGKGGKGGGGGNKIKPVTYAPDSIAAQAALVTDLTKKWNEAGADVRDSYLAQLIAAEAQLKKLKAEQAAMRDIAEGKLKGGNVQTTGLGSFTGWQEIPLAGGLRKDALEALQQQLNTIPKVTQALKDQQMAYNLAGQAAASFGQALAGIEDPAAKAAGTVIQAVASIALGFATASAQANTAGTGWGWLAWLAAGAAAMATTISTIHSLTGYAEGGEIKGNSYSGDQIPIMANAGEIVLNRAQQGALAAGLQGAGRGNNLTARVTGEQIVLAVNNYLKRTGQGEMATWG